MRDYSRTSPWFEDVGDKRRFPKLKGNVATDVAVVGGGIVGVLTAYLIAKKGLSVVLLEKNRIATGDTGYTTGFLTRMPDASIHGLGMRYGHGFVNSIFQASSGSQEFLKTLIKNEGIECDFSQCKSYYYSRIKNDPVLADEWEFISKADPNASFSRSVDTPTNAKEAIVLEGEAQFNARKFLFNLLKKKPEALKIFEESEARQITVGEDIKIETPDGVVAANKIVMATGFPHNAFSELQKLFRQKITYVITGEYNDAVPILHDIYWDTSDPYFYFRRIGSKSIMLGGCDRTASEIESDPYTNLENFMKANLPGKFKVTKKWSGSLFESEDGLPYASEHPHYKDKVFVGATCGFSGNGLVFGTLSAQILSDLVTGNKNPWAPLFSFSRTNVVIDPPMKKPVEGAKGFVKIAKISDVTEKPFCAELSGKKIAVFNLNGTYYALENSCTHAGGSLCNGTLSENAIVCPLHGAKFDVTTGNVLAGPATRPVQKFNTRISGEFLEVEITQETAGKPDRKRPRLFEGLRREKKYVLAASAIIMAFWALQFLYQFYFLIPGELKGSVIRSFALSGATLISTAIIIGPLARLTKYNFIAHRRTVGVWGFTFIVVHMLSVMAFLFNFDASVLFWTANPYANPLLFGLAAFILFIPLYMTSTDWAVDRLGFKKWKNLHRLVYMAYIFSVLHYMQINPALLYNPAGYALLIATVLALSFQTAAFVKTVAKTRTRKSVVAGLIIIALGAVMFFIAYTGFLRP